MNDNPPETHPGLSPAAGAHELGRSIIERAEPTRNPKRVVVVGAGLGGLAAAIRLAARGHHVTVVDNQDRPGGRAAVWRQDGFSFDGGPTVITAPWMLHDLFALAGEPLADHLDLVPLDPFYRIFFHGEPHDGQWFDYSANTDAMQDQIRHLSPFREDAEGYLAFVRQSERVFDRGFTDLADQPFLAFGDMARVAPDLIRLQSYRSVYGLVSRYVRDKRVRQILSFHALLIGGNPFDTTSIYALIHHLERVWGVWYAMGGTGSIVDAMVRVLTGLGGELRLNTTVTGIDVARGRATGVRTRDGQRLGADIVVANSDAVRTMRDLLPSSRRRPLGWAARRLRQSMSLMVIYFGTDRQYRGTDGPPLAHHSILLGPRYRELLDDIFHHRVLADDFSLYLHMPTLTDASIAPPGTEAFYVLAPVPNLQSNIDWSIRAGPYRDLIMRFLEEHYLPGLRKHLVAERVIDPRHFHDTLLSEDGSAFAMEPRLTQSAWFRPHNRHPRVDNLYLVGAGTHPGAGVPGVLASARIADELILATTDPAAGRVPQSAR